MLKSRMLGKPLVRFCEGRGGNRILSEFPKHPVYSTKRPPWRGEPHRRVLDGQQRCQLGKGNRFVET